MAWKNAVLIGRPEGNNADNANKGGLVIVLKDGPQGREEEVGRVAFDREEGAKKDLSFNQAADEYVATARKTIEKINELFANAGVLQ